MEQLNLFDGIDDTKFPAYHLQNPHLYDLFKKYTMEAISSGRNNFSAEAIINRMRWDSLVSGNDSFKINNTYKAFYARMFMNEFVQHKGFFRTRKSKFDSVVKKNALR